MSATSTSSDNVERALKRRRRNHLSREERRAEAGWTTDKVIAQLHTRCPLPVLSHAQQSGMNHIKGLYNAIVAAIGGHKIGNVVATSWDEAVAATTPTWTLGHLKPIVEVMASRTTPTGPIARTTFVSDVSHLKVAYCRARLEVEFDTGAELQPIDNNTVDGMWEFAATMVKRYKLRLTTKVSETVMEDVELTVTGASPAHPRGTSGSRRPHPLALRPHHAFCSQKTFVHWKLRVCAVFDRMASVVSLPRWCRALEAPPRLEARPEVSGCSALGGTNCGRRQRH